MFPWKYSFIIIVSVIVLKHVWFPDVGERSSCTAENGRDQGESEELRDDPEMGGKIKGVHWLVH